MTTEIANDDHHGPHKNILIDGKEFAAPHEHLTGRRVLELAGREPIDDFVVLWLDPHNVLEYLEIDRPIHLHHHDKVPEFFTFKTDRIFRFDLDGRRQEWGASFITEETLQKLAGAGAGCRIWQEFHGQPDRLLKPGDRADLAGEGVEKFKRECPITITVVNEENGKDYKLTGFKETKISTLIDEMYVKLGVTRDKDDRLRCEGGGDVFPFADLTLGAYLDAGHCRCLEWVFAGKSGGAACQ